MKVAAEQEPKRPSLRHRLEGEKRPNYHAKKAETAWMPTKPKKADPDVERLTLELEGAC